MKLPQDKAIKVIDHLNDTRPSLGEGISEEDYNLINDCIDKLIELIEII